MRMHAQEAAVATIPPFSRIAASIATRQSGPSGVCVCVFMCTIDVKQDNINKSTHFNTTHLTFIFTCTQVLGSVGEADLRALGLCCPPVPGHLEY